MGFFMKFLDEILKLKWPLDLLNYTYWKLNHIYIRYRAKLFFHFNLLASYMNFG